MFEEVSRNAASRLHELQRLLSHIKALDSRSELENAATLKGLFFVALYGAFECVVNQCVQILLQEIGRLNIRYNEFEPILYIVSLHPFFESIMNVTSEKKWGKRKDLLRKQISGDSCGIDDSIFSYYLQNIWFKTLVDVFECLNIYKSPVPEKRLEGYIDEVVEKRNSVAHGQQSPSEVGGKSTASDLEKCLEAITQTMTHIIEVFREHLYSREFISAAHRKRYPLP